MCRRVLTHDAEEEEEVGEVKDNFHMVSHDPQVSPAHLSAVEVMEGLIVQHPSSNAANRLSQVVSSGSR